MTTAQPQHARPGRLAGAWRGFRRWRRVRPFWGGLLTALAGLEIFGTTQMSLGGLSFQMGPTGFLSWLIPTILVACGLLMWFSPQQRVFYAVVASVTALFSLIGVNLGGFFIGLLLGMVGSALGFAWAPDAEGPGVAPEAAGPDLPGPRGPRFLVVLLALLGLSAAVALAVPDATPARAAPALPSCPPRPPSDAPVPGCVTPKPRPSRPAPAQEGRVLPRIVADRGQPLVAATPSRLTGSKVTMTGLRFAGVVELPTTGGTLKVLKFTMNRAVTDDFLLSSPGPDGRTMRFATDRLTVKGDVAFYATRFVGRLLGIKITLTPGLPIPGGIPITVPFPITFTDPVIDLAFVTSDTLTARPKLKLTLD